MTCLEPIITYFWYCFVLFRRRNPMQVRLQAQWRRRLWLRLQCSMPGSSWRESSGLDMRLQYEKRKKLRVQIQVEVYSWGRWRSREMLWRSSTRDGIVHLWLPLRFRGMHLPGSEVCLLRNCKDGLWWLWHGRKWRSCSSSEARSLLWWRRLLQELNNWLEKHVQKSF